MQKYCFVRVYANFADVFIAVRYAPLLWFPYSDYF